MAERPRGLPRLPEPTRPAVDSLPGLARLTASAAWHTTEWGARSYARAWWRVGKAAVQPEEAKLLARDVVRTASVVGDLARSVSEGVPVARALVEAGQSLGGLVEPPEVVSGLLVSGSGASPAPPSLREQGQGLLARSRDVWSTEGGHPAFERMLSEMAPDEARILVLLMRGGPQPSVDVRTGGPVGMVNSQLIAPGLTMIGPRAGCRYTDQVPSYLNNLHRLGLVWFSRESLRDPLPYQVVEAQPDVLTAMHSVKFPKVVRRSIHLTPFGEDFARTCLLEEDEAVEDFPDHATPPSAEDSFDSPSS